MNSWRQLTTELNSLLRDLRGGAPGIMKAFAGMAQTNGFPCHFRGATRRPPTQENPP